MDIDDNPTPKKKWRKISSSHAQPSAPSLPTRMPPSMPWFMKTSQPGEARLWLFPWEIPWGKSPKIYGKIYGKIHGKFDETLTIFHGLVRKQHGVISRKNLIAISNIHLNDPCGWNVMKYQWIQWINGENLTWVECCWWETLLTMDCSWEMPTKGDFPENSLCTSR